MRWPYLETTAIFVISILVHFCVEAQLDCDILDPECRAKYRSGFRYNDLRRKVNSRCNYEDIWLIPGRADASCTHPGAKKILEINPSQVHIKPEVVKFPGCFTLEIKNLKKIDSSGDQTSLASQLKGINCPQHPGFYTFRKEFCFNDWSAFDTDGDCEMDFLAGDRGDYKGALASLQQVGYGSVIAKIRLAFNATGAVERKKRVKEAQIEETVARELEERRRTWDVNNGQFDKFSQWYIEYRKNLWHKDDYLPWLVYENEISCLKLTFDVCERPPRKIYYGTRNRYTCEN
ncbi:hypothetical protein WR25_13326 [Diploscapter pachys]|uniref:DUF7753 domain-containing protein n=1 Tax=Diploscapter pachys TaxID=2018661 RepID=A0A2A2LV77_9BILA|nr:hypothetical protein WR25_13326 [Diploscapter pachys]